jgi:hypothetical protein
MGINAESTTSYNLCRIFLCISFTLIIRNSSSCTDRILLGLVRDTTTTCNKLLIFIRKMFLVKLEVMGCYYYELKLELNSNQFKEMFTICN